MQCLLDLQLSGPGNREEASQAINLQSSLLAIHCLFLGSSSQRSSQSIITSRELCSGIGVGGGYFTALQDAELLR